MDLPVKNNNILTFFSFYNKKSIGNNLPRVAVSCGLLTSLVACQSVTNTQINRTASLATTINEVQPEQVIVSNPSNSTPSTPAITSTGVPVNLPYSSTSNSPKYYDSYYESYDKNYDDSSYVSTTATAPTPIEYIEYTDSHTNSRYDQADINSDKQTNNPIQYVQYADNADNVVDKKADSPAINNYAGNNNVDSPVILPSSKTQTNHTQTSHTQMPSASTQDIQQALLERARQNSTVSSSASTSGRSSDLSNATTNSDTNNIPAYRSLMATGVSQLKSGQLASAEASFTRAQRLAPQVAAAYFYLSQIALKRGQAVKAESLARRGLTVATTTEVKQSLWQLILKSAQMQGNKKKINEAKQALR